MANVIREKNIFHNDISPHFKFLLSNERLDFCDKKKSNIKSINNTDKFSQPYLIIFTKGTNNSDHMYIFVYIYFFYYILLYFKTHYYIYLLAI